MSSKPSLTVSPSFSFRVSVKKFHVINSDHRDYNMYGYHHSKSYLFELADIHTDTNQPHLKIHTNDYHIVVPLYLTSRHQNSLTLNFKLVQCSDTFFPFKRFYHVVFKQNFFLFCAPNY